MMESRSIDTAQNASVDLMTLNKKVVNMRTVVKRAKVYVINKLTRNIADLKKKKGTDEEKEKNKQRAQRYFDEIQSIRNLKEDKVTKYSIANVHTFEEISKSTLLPGARALARLADQRFIKEAVAKFREEHSDWRDLAAFMLMQQTGRKFKSQKKDKKDTKKLLSRAENINASKLMTQAYTEGLFREEGLKLEKEKAQKKRRKKTPPVEDNDENVLEADNTTKNEKENENSVTKTKLEGKDIRDRMLNIAENQNKEEEECESRVSKKRKISETKSDDGIISKKTKIEEKKEDKKSITSSKSKLSESSVQCNKKTDLYSDKEKTNNEDEMSEEDSENDNESGEENTEDENGDDVNESDEDDDDSEEEISGESDDDDEEIDQTSQDIETETEEKPTSINKGKNKEMVVRQLDIGSDGGDSDGNDKAVSSDDSEDDDSEESDEDNEGEPEQEEEKLSKRAMKKLKNVPNFLTKSENRASKLPRDYFFEGSDNEEDYHRYEEDNEYYENGDNDDADIQDKFTGNKRTTKSLFHQPGDERRRNAYGTDTVGRGRDRGGFRDRGRGRFGERSRGGFGERGRGGFDRRRGMGETRGRGRGRGGFDRRGANSSRGRGDSERIGSNRFEDRKGSKEFTSSKHTDSLGAPKTKPGPPEKLHPSWEASRKRKAEQSGGIKAFAGTKITFDD